MYHCFQKVFQTVSCPSSNDGLNINTLLCICLMALPTVLQWPLPCVSLIYENKHLENTVYLLDLQKPAKGLAYVSTPYVS